MSIFTWNYNIEHVNEKKKTLISQVNVTKNVFPLKSQTKLVETLT